MGHGRQARIHTPQGVVTVTIHSQHFNTRGFIAAIAAASVLSSCGDGDAPRDPPEPSSGEPFPADTQGRLANGLALAGASVQFGAETGRCEVIYRIVQHIASRSVPAPTGPILEKNAKAAAAPNGSLFLSVDGYTGGDPVALQAVQDCVPYLVGKPFDP